jgi:hypothetical protein
MGHGLLVHYRDGYRTIVNLTVIGFALPFALLAVSLAMYLPGLSARMPIRLPNAIALGPLCRCDRGQLAGLHRALAAAARSRR